MCLFCWFSLIPWQAGSCTRIPSFATNSHPEKYQAFRCNHSHRLSFAPGSSFPAVWRFSPSTSSTSSTFCIGIDHHAFSCHVTIGFAGILFRQSSDHTFTGSPFIHDISSASTTFYILEVLFRLSDWTVYNGWLILKGKIIGLQSADPHLHTQT